MRALTEADVHACFVNADADELRVMAMPHDFVLTDWDYLDFFAWREPAVGCRGYVLAQIDGAVRGIVLRATDPNRARSGMCNVYHTMQSGNQVALFSARRAGAAGQRGDTVGTYLCADLSLP